MTAAALALLAVGAIGVFAQSPSQQIQAQQERAAQQSGEKLQRAIVREQREQVEHEHAQELLLQQRRAEEGRQKQAQAQAEEIQRTPDLRQEAPAAPPVAQVQPVQAPPKPDFSPGLMARALGAGLLAGALAWLLGKMVQRRFRHS